MNAAVVQAPLKEAAFICQLESFRLGIIDSVVEMNSAS
jgi:hypothetical protein